MNEVSIIVQLVHAIELSIWGRLFILSHSVYRYMENDFFHAHYFADFYLQIHLHKFFTRKLLFKIVV